MAGCGSGSGGSDEGVGTKDSPVELTFWTWQPTDAQWKSIYAAFQKKYPNIKINWWRTSEMADYQKKLQTSMAGGEGRMCSVCRPVPLWNSTAVSPTI